jgi:hypothetical protein
VRPLSFFAGVVAMFNQTFLSVMEEDSVEVCIDIEGELAITVTLNAVFQDGSASAPADYMSTEQAFSFSGMLPNGQCLMVMVAQDDFLEQDEVFMISLSSPNDVVDIVNGIVEVTILDGSELTVGFVSVEDEVLEGETLMSCVRIVNGRLADNFSLLLNIVAALGEGMYVCLQLYTTSCIGGLNYPILHNRFDIRYHW